MPRVLKQVIAPGTYYVNGRFVDFTEADIDHFARTGKAMLADRLPIRVPDEHQSWANPHKPTTDEIKARDAQFNRGFVSDFIIDKADHSLWTELDIPDQKTADRLATEVKFVSPRILPTFTDGEGKTWGDGKGLIAHVALTPKPVWHKQKPFGEQPISPQAVQLSLPDFAEGMDLSLADRMEFRGGKWRPVDVASRPADLSMFGHHEEHPVIRYADHLKGHDYGKGEVKTLHEHPNAKAHPHEKAALHRMMEQHHAVSAAIHREEGNHEAADAHMAAARHHRDCCDSCGANMSIPTEILNLAREEFPPPKKGKKKPPPFEKPTGEEEEAEEANEEEGTAEGEAEAESTPEEDASAEGGEDESLEPEEQEELAPGEREEMVRRLLQFLPLCGIRLAKDTTVENFLPRLDAAVLAYHHAKEYHGVDDAKRQDEEEGRAEPEEQPMAASMSLDSEEVILSRVLCLLPRGLQLSNDTTVNTLLPRLDRAAAQVAKDKGADMSQTATPPAKKPAPKKPEPTDMSVRLKSLEADNKILKGNLAKAHRKGHEQTIARLVRNGQVDKARADKWLEELGKHEMSLVEGENIALARVLAEIDMAASVPVGTFWSEEEKSAADARAHAEPAPDYVEFSGHPEDREYRCGPAETITPEKAAALCDQLYGKVAANGQK